MANKDKRSRDKLTVREVETAVCPADQKVRKLADGGGLYLEIRRDGARYWRWKYRFAGAERSLSFGTFPETSLREARERREAARALLRSGTDPSERRKEEREAQEAARIAAESAVTTTFKAVAEDWIARAGTDWAASHRKAVESRLANHVYGEIGGDQISALNGPRLVQLLRKVEADSSPEIAHRCRRYVSAIFVHAMNAHLVTGNPTPHPSILSKVRNEHFPTITDPKGIGALMRAIDAYPGSYVVRAALRLAPRLFVRPGELRAAEWSEMDLDAGEWRIPAERMKMRRPHVVPLSAQAVEILRELHKRTGVERAPGLRRYVFPSERGPDRPMSENTLNVALRTLDYSSDQIVAHGFRHMASTLLHESRKFDSLVIERQLAHKDTNRIRGVYNSAEYLDERRAMMQWYADHLDSLAAAKNVVAFNRAA